MDKHKTPVKIWFITAWFATSVTALIFAITLSFYLATPKLTRPNTDNFKLYTALPKSSSYLSEEIEHTDARAKIIEDFFKGYKSPLSDYSNNFIKVSEKYNLDWRLLPSIAMQESNGGKRIIKDSYNPFGYGIYGGMVIKFKNWEDAIERVAKALREDYLNKGMRTPAQIMAKYNPPSLSNNGAWAKGIYFFMEELQ